MPVPGDRLRLEHRRRGGELHQHDDNGGHCNGDRGVHGNADWAVIGNRRVGMEVRNLNDGQEGEQDQTQNGNNGQSG